MNERTAHDPLWSFLAALHGDERWRAELRHLSAPALEEAARHALRVDPDRVREIVALIERELAERESLAA